MIENYGIDGDKHAGNDKKQIIVLTASTLERIKPVMDKGLCLKRFKENLEIGLVNPDVINEGSVLQIAGTKLIVNAKGKKCFDNCKLNNSGKQCALSGEVLFAAVKKGGIIKLEDSVSID